MDGTKVCNICGEEKELEAGFYKFKKGEVIYYRNKCKRCTDTKKTNESGVNTPRVKKTVQKTEKRRSLGMISNEDILILKEMIEKYKNKKTAYAIIEDVVLEKKGKKTKKQTYVIEENLIKRIENYCVKNRISKSDFINIAILKMLNE